LSKKLENEFQKRSSVVFISRQVSALFWNNVVADFCFVLQYFDQDRGADLLKKVINNIFSIIIQYFKHLSYLLKVLVGNVDADILAKYTVLSGSYCLLRYIENCHNSSFASHSIR